MATINERNSDNMMSEVNQKLTKIELDVTSLRYQQVGMLACFILLGLMGLKIAKAVNVA